MPKDKTPKELNQLYTDAKGARGRYEPVWFMNHAYYQGNQWVRWDGGKLFRPQMRKDRITIVDNRIQPCVRTEVAKMTKNRPVFTVTPRTADEEDANAAELAEQLMRYLWQHLNLTEKLYRALEWSRVVCAGFVKAFWDPTLGDGDDFVTGPEGILQDAQGNAFRADQVDPQQLSQQLGVPVGTKTVNQGDIRIEVRSPFQMLIDPLVENFSEAEWVIEESVQSVERIRKQYGKKVEADTPGNPGLVESRMGAQAAGAYKGARIREYWCKPNSDHPDGCRVVWCKDEELHRDDKPFDPCPYIMLTGIPVPGRLWPSSIVEQLRGPQTELNKVLSQIAENCNRVGNPTLLVSKQSVQDPDRFVDSMTMPGGVHFFDDLGSANAVPTYLQAPSLPPYVTERVVQILESIQDISGQHEVTSANVPPGVTAASAINLLQEADDTRLGPAMTDYETNLGKLGQKILKLAAHYYTDTRTVAISGDDGQWRLKDFRGSMLRDNTHAEVQSGSAFPQSKAAKQAMLQDLMNMMVQSGNPPHGKQFAQLLELFGIGGLDRLVEDYTLDEQQAKRENAKMLQGIPVPLNDYDNDEAHIDAHTDEQKSQRYEQQPPQIKQLFEMHVAAHRQREAQTQQAQMQLQMQMQGQPPPQQAAQEMQGQAQQQALQATQGAQQLDQAAQQQGMSQAQAEQQMRHAEETHHQKMQHAHELHQRQLQTQGGPRGRQ